MSRVLKYNNRILTDLDPDAKLFFERAGLNSESNLDVDGLYTAEQARYWVNWLVKGLKINGLWGKMLAVYLHLGGNESVAVHNLISDDYELDYTDIILDEIGIKSNGNNGFANTHLKPTNTLFTDNMHISFYTPDDIVSNSIDIGARNLTVEDAQLAYYGYLYNSALLSSGFDRATSSETLSDGFSASSRTSNNELFLYRNSKIVGELTTTVTIKYIDEEIYLCNLGGIENIYGSPRRQSTTTIGYGLSFSEMNKLETLVKLFNKNLKVLNAQKSVFFGDSITEGYGVGFNRWSSQLSKYRNWVEDNKAISGTTLQNTLPKDIYSGPNMMDRASTDIPTYTSSYKYLFIAYGVNDCRVHANYTASIYGSQLGDIIDIAISKGWVASDIKVLTPYYILDWGEGSESKIEDIRDEVISVCLAKGCQSLNVYDNMTSADVDTDNIHPNLAGHNTIFNYIKSQL